MNVADMIRQRQERLTTLVAASLAEAPLCNPRVLSRGTELRRAFDALLAVNNCSVHAATLAICAAENNAQGAHIYQMLLTGGTGASDAQLKVMASVLGVTFPEGDSYDVKQVILDTVNDTQKMQLIRQNRPKSWSDAHGIDGQIIRLRQHPTALLALRHLYEHAGYPSFTAFTEAAITANPEQTKALHVVNAANIAVSDAQLCKVLAFLGYTVPEGQAAIDFMIEKAKEVAPEYRQHAHIKCLSASGRNNPNSQAPTR